LIVFEVYILFILATYIPTIIQSVRNSSLPTLFSFPEAVDNKMKSSSTVVKVICMEMLMLYYAFLCWRKKPILKENRFTLYKNSSLIATYIMLIHSILLETIAVHCWLYGDFPVISIILLVFNIYSVLFLIGNLQAIRNNAIQNTEEYMYLSFGLMKRMKVKWDNIEEIIDDSNVLQKKLTKDTIDFIARDFGEATPHFILKLKEPTESWFILGMKKSFTYVAIRADEPSRLKKDIRRRVHDVGR